MILDFFAGCIGGCAGVIVGYPMDTVKVHLQTQDVRTAKYKGAFGCFRSLLKTDGVRGLYRGMSSPLAGVAAINAIVFGVYGNMQRNFENPDALSSHFLAGATAGLFQSFLCSPMELAKTYIQIVGCSEGPVHCLRNIYKLYGFRGIFKGLGITICREVPSFGTYFVTYEYLTQDKSKISTEWMLLAGGLAGVASWLIVYPLDVLKTRIQTDGLIGPKNYKNSLECFKKTVQGEGYSALMRGATPTVLRAFPTNAVCFTVVTWCMRLFEENNGATSWEKHSDGILNLQRAEVCQS